MTKLSKIEGVTGVHMLKLKSARVTTIEKLLLQGATAQGRKEIARKTRITEKTIERWVHHADFFRIKGMAGLKAELLDTAGVATMKKLGSQNASRLQTTLLNINKKKKLVERVPGLVQVERWVKTARKINKIVK